MNKSRDNVADEKNIQTKGRLERRREARQVANLKYVMATPAGREFMWSLLERTHIYSSSFTGNSETFFREGERNIGLFVTAQLNKDCVDEYAQMQREAIKRDEDERKELESTEQEGK